MRVLGSRLERNVRWLLTVLGVKLLPQACCRFSAVMNITDAFRNVMHDLLEYRLARRLIDGSCVVMEQIL